MHNNILFTSRVRNKRKSFFSSYYYESDKISLKEKIYTFRYNLERTGLTTKGELDWAERIMKIDFKTYNQISEQFKKDYIDFEMHSK